MEIITNDEQDFGMARRPTDEEYNLAKKVCEDRFAEEMGGIGVDKTTGVIYVETISGREFKIIL